MRIKESIVRTLIEKAQDFSKTELKNLLHIDNEGLEEFENAINELKKENIIFIKQNKKIGIHNDLKDKIFIGKFLIHNKGYGFAIKINPAEKNDKIRELFIPPSKIENAMNEDIIIAKISNIDTSDNTKCEGEVVSILERGITTLVGTYIPSENFGFVIADSSKIKKDIYIPLDGANGAKAYDKVIVKITKYPVGDRKAEGIIEEVIGFKFDKGVDLQSIIAEYGLRDVFPRKVIQQVEKLSPPVEEDLKYRKDLTDKIIYTIDGEDSKDLDDAISLEMNDDGTYKLGVHIADVTHYVKEGTPLDKEALERGTSVYLINKVLPMLPKKLSNGLCSLNKNELKLTLSVFMNINKKGDVIHHEICESYIKSKARLCYKEVTKFIEGTGDLDVPDGVKESLMLAKDLAKILEKKRIKRGALEFNFTESHIELDDNDVPIKIEGYERGISNDIIEEFMVITNEVVAEHFFSLDLPFVYRIHEKPKQERIEVFTDFIRKLGYEIPTDMSPKALQDILLESKGKAGEEAINLLLLQSMQQARYSPVEMGHFGLGAEYYSHFTSPIRRYPDLQIHRIIKEYLHNRISNTRKANLIKIVDFSSKLSSKRERQAQNAELEFDAYKKAEYMSTRLNEEFEGIVIGINKSGCKLLLDSTIEGFLPLSKIGYDKFALMKDNCMLLGVNTNKSIFIGDRLKVKVSEVNLEVKQIVFELLDFVNSQEINLLDDEK